MITTYVCKPCNLKWTVEINKCINCNKKINIQEGTRLTVVGTTKIENPSTTHPDTPYYVLLIKDEYNNLRPIKTDKNYKIGDKFA